MIVNDWLALPSGLKVVQNAVIGFVGEFEMAIHCGSNCGGAHFSPKTYVKSLLSSSHHPKSRLNQSYQMRYVLFSVMARCRATRSFEAVTWTWLLRSRARMNLLKPGRATAVMIPKITSTTMSSVNVKPLSWLRSVPVLTRDSNMDKRLLTRDEFPDSME